GTAGLALHAADEGGGVYRVALSVDGHEAVRQGLGGGSASCSDVDPDNADAHEFGSPQPCPLDASGAVQLDTTTLRDGPPALRATVEAAAGNETVVYDDTIRPHTAPINANVPALSGTASIGAQLGATTGDWDGAPTAYAHRWLRCEADG